MKKILNKIINKVGFVLKRNNASANPVLQLKLLLKGLQTTHVFDIGANTGQFAMDLRASGYQGKIISFEPQSQAYKTLIKNSRNDQNWLVHQRSAVGNEASEVFLNVSENSVSSSILSINENHLSAAAHSQYVCKEKCSVIKLDDIVDFYCANSNKLFLKIDTQGFEENVILGAKETLLRSSGIMCELSLIELYDGQRKWKEMIELMDDYGFELWAIQPGFCDPNTGRTLQVDGLFKRVCN